MNATRHWPQIKVIAAMICSTNLIWKDLIITQLRAVEEDDFSIILVDIDGKEHTVSKLMLNASQFSPAA